MKKVLAFTLAVLLCMSVAGCGQSADRKFYESKEMLVHVQHEPNPDGMENVATDKMLSQLQDVYGMGSLNGFELYNEGYSVIAIFRFAEDVGYDELDLAINFGYSKLHMGVLNQISNYEIDSWLVSVGVPVDQTSFDISEIYIFAGENELLYQCYEDLLPTEKYEATSALYGKKVDELKKIVDGVKLDIDFDAANSLLGAVVLVQGRGDMLSRRNYEELEQHLANNAEGISNVTERKYIVLQLYNADGQIYSEDVFSMVDGRLTRENVDWMTLKPY